MIVSTDSNISAGLGMRHVAHRRTRQSRHYASDHYTMADHACELMGIAVSSFRYRIERKDAGVREQLLGA
jgi:hypothetical protein